MVFFINERQTVISIELMIEIFTLNINFILSNFLANEYVCYGFHTYSVIIISKYTSTLLDNLFHYDVVI